MEFVNRRIVLNRGNMQRYQRQRHRLIWIALGPLLVLIFLYGILNRPEWPIQNGLPEVNPSEEVLEP